MTLCWCDPPLKLPQHPSHTLKLTNVKSLLDSPPSQLEDCHPSQHCYALFIDQSMLHTMLQPNLKQDNFAISFNNPESESAFFQSQVHGLMLYSGWGCNLTFHTAKDNAHAYLPICMHTLQVLACLFGLTTHPPLMNLRHSELRWAVQGTCSRKIIH